MIVHFLFHLLFLHFEETHRDFLGLPMEIVNGGTDVKIVFFSVYHGPGPGMPVAVVASSCKTCRDAKMTAEDSEYGCMIVTDTLV